MHNKLADGIMSLLLASAVAGFLFGCAELQQVAESAARQSGNEQLAGDALEGISEPASPMR